MITLSVEPANIYSCQFCGRLFESKQDYLIEQEFYPVCSSKCGFMVVYNFLKKSQLNDETLLEMQKIAENKEEIKDFKTSSARYSISKYYLKFGLANIKFLKLMRQECLKMRQTLSKGTMGQHFPSILYRGNVPCLVPSSVSSDKKKLVPSFIKKGVISKWF